MHALIVELSGEPAHAQQPQVELRVEIGHYR
jgi:hypothetical protein